MPRNQTVVKRYALAIQVKAVTTTEEEERVVGGPRLSPHIEIREDVLLDATGQRETLDQVVTLAQYLISTLQDAGIGQ